MVTERYNKKHKHFLKLGMRFLKLYFKGPNQTKKFVKNDYDFVSTYYDSYWTEHTHKLSEDMLRKLNLKKKQKALDLTCGTGFVTSISNF